MAVHFDANVGEAVPVEKTSETIRKANVPVGDRKNIAFMSTNVRACACTFASLSCTCCFVAYSDQLVQVIKGRGKGIVVATGQCTEVPLFPCFSQCWYSRAGR
jgi:magnesium-transporting ATPase (P-type)